MPALPQQTSDSCNVTNSRPGMRPNTGARLEAHTLRMREVTRIVIRDSHGQWMETRGQLHVELGDHLHDVANLCRELRGAVRPERIIGEQLSVLLHRRAAAGAVHHDVVEVERFHLRDEAPHPFERGALASGVDLERSAAALQRRHQHLAPVRGQDARGGAVDVGEERVLHAAGEDRDALDLAALRDDTARRAHLEVGDA